MEFGVVNKSTILNRFFLHTLQRNITHLAIITRKTNIKLGILKGGNWKRAIFLKEIRHQCILMMVVSALNKHDSGQKLALFLSPPPHLLIFIFETTNHFVRLS